METFSGIFPFFLQCPSTGERQPSTFSGRFPPAFYDGPPKYEGAQPRNSSMPHKVKNISLKKRDGIP
ncbi:hypothetical protein CXT89_11140 [Akkermansia muciniphila]|nr:hypothetical protein CXT97_09360 [Akkermansia muciniphila]PNC91880.1 hypothetical protein CXT89_11140 [Akkermansia muciniphila]PND02068.1 hypothetical protein CXT90_01055 [Akkermansia muciniphila]